MRKDSNFLWVMKGISIAVMAIALLIDIFATIVFAQTGRYAWCGVFTLLDIAFAYNIYLYFRKWYWTRSEIT
jgi:hypothetical protein